jgi:hypothetical protein
VLAKTGGGFAVDERDYLFMHVRYSCIHVAALVFRLALRDTRPR